MADYTVSIVMPVRDERDFIAGELEAILTQDYPHSLIQVLVVDGQSQDGTARIATDFSERFKRQGFRDYKVLSNQRRTTPAALNVGIAEADGDIIFRIDGHSRVRSDHVSHCISVLDRTLADNVGGGLDAIGRTKTGRAIALATTSRFGVGGSTFRHGKTAGWAQTVYPGAFRKEVFARVGVFDEELVRNQDDEFNLRLTQHGGRIWFDPEIRTEHYARDSLAAHLKQHFEFGLYKVLVMHKRQQVASVRHLVPGAFVTALATGTVLSVVLRSRRYLVAVTIPYAMASVAAASWTARHTPRLVPRLIAAYATMHVGYGAGSLAGLWRWRGRRNDG